MGKQVGKKVHTNRCDTKRDIKVYTKLDKLSKHIQMNSKIDKKL